MIDSRKIEDLDGPAEAVCRAHVAACAVAGIELLVTSTYRDAESQDALYAIGRTAQMERKPVTNARGGQSWHNYRVAWDVVPLIGGKAQWDSPLWKEIIRIGKAVGAEAGAEWKSFKDKPHFQAVGGLTLKQAKERFDVSGSIFI